MKAMTFLGQYVLVWGIIGLIAVSTMLVIGTKRASVQCIDGSLVISKSECPQCTNTSQCGRDKTCDKNKCVAKACRFQSDCDTTYAQCIYQKCVVDSADAKIHNEGK